MALPKYTECYLPLLTAIQDGRSYTMKEIRAAVAEMLCLSDAELAEMLPSGKQRVFDNRIGWARTYLQKAGLVTIPRRACVQITDEALQLLKSGITITDELLMERYPTFAEFKTGKTLSQARETVAEETVETPQETFERMYQTINAQLADDLLTEIMNQSPDFFEQLVVDLMRSMHYGDGFVTKRSGDGGVDGIIHEDKLGFNLIYIQAKRWSTDTTVGKPEIQKFAGAMMGPPKVEKGLFITTAKFSQGARDFAEAQHILLLDGKRLTELMIEHGLGVSTQKTYQIKRIDSDYFSEG